MILLDSLIPLVYMVLPGWIINELMQPQRTNVLGLYVVLLAVAPIVHSATNYFMNKVVYKTRQDIDLQFEIMFYSHTLQTDYEMLEKPDIQIAKDRADETIHDIIDSADRIFSLVTSVCHWRQYPIFCSCLTQ